MHHTAMTMNHTVQPADRARDAAQADAQDRAGERGFTLIEVLGALVVGSLVFSFAAFAISGAIESARVASFNETLALLRVNVHEVYASTTGFGSTSTKGEDITQELADAGAVPLNWIGGEDRNGTSVIHNLGGSVTVNGGLATFTISAGAITEEACRKVVSAQYGNWDAITVNGSEVDSVPYTDCTADSDGEGRNTLVFTAH